jgi:RHS repeat-associated protein
MRAIAATAVLGLGLAFAQAQAQTYTVTDTIEYHDDLSKWVLGQVDRKTTAGIETERYEYGPTTVLPTKAYRFGKLQQTVVYRTDGTIYSISAPRDDATFNTTVLFSSWKRGIPQLIQYPGGVSKSAVVGDLGTIDSITDENGYTTTYDYDEVGRLTRINYPINDQKSWHDTIVEFEPISSAEYGIPAGHWRQLTTVGYGKKATYFDGLWRPLLVREFDLNDIAGSERFQRFEYDAEGRQTFASYFSKSSTIATGTRTTYDALGRPTLVQQDSELGPLSTTTQYLDGFKTRTTNPRGYYTTVEYQTYDSPTTDWPISIAQEGGVFTDITRDVFGSPKTITRRNSTGSLQETRSYSYWADTRELCRSVEPETGATLMGYDQAGNLAWSATGLPETTPCDREGDTAIILARKAVRTYDERNRVVGLTFPDQLGDTTYTYTPDGLLETVVAFNDGATATNTYAYNKRRLLTTERLQHGSIDWSVGHVYNNSGALTSQVYPDGRTVDYSTNALGQATRVANPNASNPYAWSVTYHPNGAVRSFVYGNGERHQMDQNDRGLPELSHDWYDSTDLVKDAYEYDQNGNVAAIIDGTTVAQRGSRTMTYDRIDRLRTVVSPMYGGKTVTYDYDILDNLTYVDAPGRTHYYCYDQSWRLTNVKTDSCAGTSVIGLGYDDNGNVANKNGVEYDFDYGNRLRSVSQGGVQVASYAYDGHGRRVRATMSDNIFSMYGQDGTLLYQEDRQRGKRISHFYLAGDPVSQFEVDIATGAAANRYVHTDALGSPVVITNGPHQILERSEYEPYGKIINRSLRDGVGYTGHVEDAATGLNYMQQRYYDPQVGRFLSVDPVTANSTNGSNFNRYWYANNNPYRFTDPDGRRIKLVNASKDPEDREQAIADLDKLLSKPAGANLVQSLNKTPTVITIKVGNEKRIATNPVDPQKALAGKSTGSVIDFNPDVKNGGLNSEGSTQRPSYVDLAHELGHAKALDAGTQSFDSGTGVPGTTPPREEPSMEAENAVRSEHGLPLRPSYYFVEP